MQNVAGRKLLHATVYSICFFIRHSEKMSLFHVCNICHDTLKNDTCTNTCLRSNFFNIKRNEKYLLHCIYHNANCQREQHVYNMLTHVD